MSAKLHSHKVTLNERRRTNKKTRDLMKKGVSKENLQQVFDSYYRDQVRALYRAIYEEK